MSAELSDIEYKFASKCLVIEEDINDDVAKEFKLLIDEFNRLVNLTTALLHENTRLKCKMQGEPNVTFSIDNNVVSGLIGGKKFSINFDQTSAEDIQKKTTEFYTRLRYNVLALTGEDKPLNKNTKPTTRMLIRSYVSDTVFDFTFFDSNGVAKPYWYLTNENVDYLVALEIALSDPTDPMHREFLKEHKVIS
jgi:hypothetical protein